MLFRSTMLLDVDSWAAPLDAAAGQSGEPPAIPATLQAGAGVLRSAGWRVAIVRRGDTTAGAWRLLLAGIESGGRPLIGVRR